MTREFGPSPFEGERRPAVHLPYLISKRLVRDLKSRFHHEFEATASHSFRHQDDLQYSFTYNHYISHTRVYAPSMAQIWRQALLTADSNDFLFGDEIKESHQAAHEDFVRQTPAFHHLKDCANDLLKKHTTNSLAQCQEAVITLRDTYELRLPMREIELPGFKDAEFACFTDNLERSIKILDRVEKEPKKFLCFEDDMHEPIPAFEERLRKFYHTMYPEPSPFERNSN